MYGRGLFLFSPFHVYPASEQPQTDWPAFHEGLHYSSCRLAVVGFQEPGASRKLRPPSVTRTYADCPQYGAAWQEKPEALRAEAGNADGLACPQGINQADREALGARPPHHLVPKVDIFAQMRFSVGTGRVFRQRQGMKPVLPSACLLRGAENRPVVGA